MDETTGFLLDFDCYGDLRSFEMQADLPFECPIHFFDSSDPEFDPYEYPGVRHLRELDDSGTADTARLLRRDAAAPNSSPPFRSRRSARLPLRCKSPARLFSMRDKGLSTERQQYDITADHRRSSLAIPTPGGPRCRTRNQWQVTPVTARLLKHWRHPCLGSVRPFFCQVEAVETAIWLTGGSTSIAPRQQSDSLNTLH